MSEKKRVTKPGGAKRAWKGAGGVTEAVRVGVAVGVAVGVRVTWRCGVGVIVAVVGPTPLCAARGASVCHCGQQHRCKHWGKARRA